MTFGDQVNEKEASDIIGKAVDMGVNFIDCANVYTGGNSERIVGKIIKPYRDKIILATKGGYPIDPEGNVNDSGASRRNLIRTLEESLHRLDTDYIDLFYLHHPIYDVPADEVYCTLSDFVRSGKVRYIGVSNMASWQLCEALWRNDLRSGISPAVTQNAYNLLTRGVENELVPFIEKYNLGMVAYNPVAAGLLTGKHKFETLTENTRFTLSMGKAYRDRYWNKENFDAVDKLKTLAADSGLSLIELAMSWVASRPFVNSIITGVSKTEHVESNIKAIEKAPLPPEIMKFCDDLWTQLSGNRYKYNR
jgi:aryl-alcohol dehydrogenase (NADP+)